MVVEDDADLADALGEFLIDGGYRVLYARDCAQALEILETETPDLIVFDLMMPGVDGWEFRNRQQCNPSLTHIPVLVLSALDRQERAIDADRFLRKPFRPEELLNAVQRLTAQHRKWLRRRDSIRVRF